MSIIEENSTRVITRYRETREINCLNKKRSSLNSCGTSDKTSDQKKSPSLSDSGSGLGESGCEELLGEKLMRDFKYSYNYICNDCDTWSEQRLIQLDREEGVAATLLGFGIRKNKIVPKTVPENCSICFKKICHLGNNLRSKFLQQQKMDNPVHPENCSCNVCFLPYYTPNPQEQQGMHQNQQYYSSSMSNVLYTQQQANLQPDINLYPQFPFDVPSSSDYRPPNIQNQLNLIQDFVDYSDEYTSTGQASTCFPPGDHFAFPVMPSVSTEAIPILESFQQELEQPSTSRGLPGQSTDTEENQVSKKRKMNCPECNKVFNHTGDYKKHMRKHTKEKPFPCSQCGKKFSVTSNLHRHKKSEHSDDRPFQCDYCTKTFKRKDKLDNHKKCCKKKFDRERK